MDIYKKILSVIVIALLSVSLLGCTAENGAKDREKVEIMDFPKTDTGYPMGNAVVINGETYALDDIEQAVVNAHVEYEINLKSTDVPVPDGIMEVILPQKNPIHLWDIEQNENIDLISYEKQSLKIHENNVSEGASNNLQIFRFLFPAETDMTVSFKWSNVNEIEKSFHEKSANYLLKIKISYP